jgi:hypothetical protein
VVNRRTACLPRPLAAALLTCWLAGVRPAGAASAPRPDPTIGRFDIAGVTLGMTLPEALRIITKTFADEGLSEVTPIEPHSYTNDAAGPNAVVRIALAVAASTPGEEPTFQNDRFQLLLAGPAANERITAIVRDYLGPRRLDRTAVLRSLFKKYGPPTGQMTPPGDVGTDSSTLEWLFQPGGGRTGEGAQGEMSARCTAGLFQYQDYFEHAGPDEQADMMDLLRQQKADGCGLVMQISFAYDAVHYGLYDTALAREALQQPGGVVAAKLPRRPAVDAAAVQAAAAMKY